MPTSWNALFTTTSSPRHDGKAFYYTNTLHQREPGVDLEQDELSERAEASLRAPWFEVSCCPTNLARTLSSLNSYFATADEHGVQIHHFGDVDIDATTGDGQAIQLSMRTNYPANGNITIRVMQEARYALAVRIPSWALGGATADLDGETLAISGDYLVVEQPLKLGTVLNLTLPMEARLSWPSSKIDAIRGTAAIERGPQVLCLESVDLPEGVVFENLELDPSATMHTESNRTVVTLKERTEHDATAFPYGKPSLPDVNQSIHAPLVPYADWANRGPSKMRVWIPTTSPVIPRIL